MKLSSTQKQFLLDAAISYKDSLPGSPAEEYLENRGLITPGAAQFRLGYVADPLPGHEYYRGMLAIPYLRRSTDKGWSVVSIRFRCIEDHEHSGHGKYMGMPGDKPRLFNTIALTRENDEIAITEGELDAVAAVTAGIPAVGLPGATTWQDYFREPFLGYQRVFVLADGDDPGMRFAHSVGSHLPNAVTIPMPKGEDVNSFVLKEGKQALVERIRS